MHFGLHKHFNNENFLTSVTKTHSQAHTHTRVCAHTHTHTHTRKRTHTQSERRPPDQANGTLSKGHKLVMAGIG